MNLIEVILAQGSTPDRRPRRLRAVADLPSTRERRWHTHHAAAAPRRRKSLKSDDNTAFPYGCSAENVYDRFCSDGTYDMYDYRSPDERRRTNVVDLSFSGGVLTGSLVHRGLEATVATRIGPWNIGGGATALHARRDGSADDAMNGLRPVNAPACMLKLQLGYRVASVPGLELLANGLYESDRIVMPDNSLSIPGVSRLDLGLRYEQRLAGNTLVWRAGVQNATNEDAWRESPFQFGHAFLFPMPPRTFAVSLQASL